jgi:hypothetical protein
VLSSLCSLFRAHPSVSLAGAFRSLLPSHHTPVCLRVSPTRLILLLCVVLLVVLPSPILLCSLFHLVCYPSIRSSPPASNIKGRECLLKSTFPKVHVFDPSSATLHTNRRSHSVQNAYSFKAFPSMELQLCRNRAGRRLAAANCDRLGPERRRSSRSGGAGGGADSRGVRSRPPLTLPLGHTWKFKRFWGSLYSLRPRSGRNSNQSVGRGVGEWVRCLFGEWGASAEGVDAVFPGNRWTGKREPRD